MKGVSEKKRMLRSEYDMEDGGEACMAGCIGFAYRLHKNGAGQTNLRRAQRNN